MVLGMAQNAYVRHYCVCQCLANRLPNGNGKKILHMVFCLVLRHKNKPIIDGKHLLQPDVVTVTLS